MFCLHTVQANVHMLAITNTGIKLVVHPWNGQVLDLHHIQSLSIMEASHMLILL